MQQPKVSIIIPVYNVEKWLRDCLDSVLAQTMQDLEVLCIDDASPDNSGMILDEYAGKDPRFRVFHLQQNQMQGHGRNLGLKEARGQYVYFLDSDDKITPESMEELYQICERDRLDGVFFDSQALFETEALSRKFGAYPAVRKGTYPDTVLSGVQLFDLFNEQDEYLVYVQREFWRRAFLLEHDIWNLEHVEHEDEFFTFQAILMAERVRYLPKTYFIRRYREDSVMTRKRMPKDFHGYFLTFDRMTDFAERRGLDTPGLKKCLLHMWDVTVSSYDSFLGEDPAEWFSEEEMKLLRQFRNIMEMQELVRERDREIFSSLMTYRMLEIYGAGRVASAVFHRLQDLSFRITGIWVTDRTGQPDELFGLPVREISEHGPQEENSIILVAMTENFQKEVSEVLAKMGYRYCLYVANRLQGPFGPGTDMDNTKKDIE